MLRVPGAIGFALDQAVGKAIAVATRAAARDQRHAHAHASTSRSFTTIDTPGVDQAAPCAAFRSLQE